MNNQEIHLEIVTPKISIIVAVFNGVATLQKCIDSIETQSYKNKELIVIDGGSRDGTVALIKRNSKKISYSISEPDHGIYNAWNKGLKRASGAWICFLGADDYFWDARVLEKVALQLSQLHTDIRIAYGKIIIINAQGEQFCQFGESWQKAKHRFRLMKIPHPGTMHRRSVFEQHGKFDESFHIAGDYEFLLRELKTADAFFIPNLITVAMLQGGISSNPANSLKLLHEARRAERMHGQWLPSLIWLVYLLKIYLRLLLCRTLGERQGVKIFNLCRRMVG